MSLRLTLAFGIVLAGSAAQALDCQLVNLAERVDSIMRAQAKPTAKYQQTETLGIGVLSKPRNMECSGSDWTNETTCTGTQTFTGTLYSVHGVADVKDTPIQTTFYEYALNADLEPPYDSMQPWTKEAMLISFSQPIDGPLEMVHIDTCANGLIMKATEQLDAAVRACHAKGRCPGKAGRFLKSLNQSVF
ncbi:hypothetical protein [Roseovarius sp. 2305UL8-3]|uniref:hypothetical protein n=1 Tax=Roseovarius conchicola TaxID=3121636 RepID=UPI00352883B3